MKFWVTYPLVAHPHNPEFLTKSALTRFCVAAEDAGFEGIGFTDHPAPTERVAPVRASAAGAQLTDRQIEVLRLIERGMSNKEIGLALNLSEKTVKVHVTGIFRALNVVTRTQAASEARSAGLV